MQKKGVNCVPRELRGIRGPLVSSLSLSFSSYLVLINLAKRFIGYTLDRSSITFTANGKREICTTWPSFPLTCRLLFIISTHKLVVSRNFVSIRVVLSCFESFSILRNSHLESAVCRLPYTRSVVACIPWAARKWHLLCVVKCSCPRI